MRVPAHAGSAISIVAAEGGLPMRRFSFLLACILIAASLAPARAGGYRTSIGSGEDRIPVVVVSGSPYEMGYSYGQLMRADIEPCLKQYIARARAQDAFRFSDFVLDAAWRAAAPHVSARFIDEMRGVADGAGVSYGLLRRAHCASIVERLACNAVAVWGSASADGRLYQIRDLEYTMNAGLQDHPALVVYLPERGIAHVNVAFAGFVGSLAGMNAQGIVLSEIGGWDEMIAPVDFDGVPFFAMFRDILQEASSLDAALDMIQRAKRIKQYTYVIGDGRRRQAVALEAGPEALRILTEQDFAKAFAAGGAPNAVIAVPLDPAAFAANRGRYNAARLVDLCREVDRGFTLLSVVYEATAREMWVAYAKGTDLSAAKRPYAHFKLRDYLKPRTP
jgi:isopenicillin-N N-acyltransferase-like protein